MATFLGRLRRDTRGNTLAIMAAALIPLIAMVGSGVDMTRVYMAQNRLRQACDAGVLAGRRMLTGTIVTDELRKETLKYFDFNFPRAPRPFFEAESFEPDITVPQPGTLAVSARTTIPATIMKMFGFDKLDIAAACSATQDFVGTDIMLVVDMSGSMNCAPGVGGACNEVEAHNSKMSALRSAAASLYDTLKDAQDQLRANNLRLRYGFMPYNATVNVGRLVYAKNPQYIRSGTYEYNTRIPDTENTTTTTSRSNCNSLGGTYRAFLGDWLGQCSYQRIIDWEWGKFPVDISSYVTGASVPTPGSDSATSRSTWAGCIEERKTNRTTINGGTAVTAPSDAWDLDINRIPGADDDSKWAPWWPEVTYRPNATRPDTAAYYCASEASRLREYYNDKAGFTRYLSLLKPAGATYHDIGMIWGARFLSPDGIFASATPETNNQNDPDNPKKLRGFNVRKYLIFMTDGDMAPSNAYSSYGIEDLDKRVLGNASGSTAQLNRHLQRFRMACNAAKSQNIEIWVIAFATTLTNDMRNCASDTTKAAGISTTPELIAKFQEIGSKIGSLRLSK